VIQPARAARGVRERNPRGEIARAVTPRDDKLHALAASLHPLSKGKGNVTAAHGSGAMGILHGDTELAIEEAVVPFRRLQAKRIVGLPNCCGHQLAIWKLAAGPYREGFDQKAVGVLEEEH